MKRWFARVVLCILWFCIGLPFIGGFGCLIVVPLDWLYRTATGAPNDYPFTEFLGAINRSVFFGRPLT